MRADPTVLLACSLVVGIAGAATAADPKAMGPLRVHPDNPRYFGTPAGKAVWLTGSHTWANRQERGVEGETPDFDYPGYLDFLERHGHNFIRLWAWEHAQWMQFADRATPVRYEPLPYARTGPGKALDGKPKFDLTKFNPEYFKRLRDRVEQARKRGIYVGVMLFQGFSLSKVRGKKGVGNAWHGHPFHPANNINGVDGNPSDDDTGHEVHTLKVPRVTALQEAYVRKTIETVGDLDNVLWEITNESQVASVPWQYHMIRFIKKVEADRPMRHPAGMTGWGRIDGEPLLDSPADWISPGGVRKAPPGRRWFTDPPANDGRKVVLVDSDHGRAGKHDPRWVWKNFARGNQFILMDSYVDYRFGAPKKPDPDWEPTRLAMGVARKLSERINLAAMTPRTELASTQYCLADPDREYVIYRPKEHERAFQVMLKPGRYTVQWIDPVTGKTAAGEGVHTEGGRHEFRSPTDGGTVLHLKRREPAD